MQSHRSEIHLKQLSKSIKRGNTLQKKNSKNPSVKHNSFNKNVVKDEKKIQNLTKNIDNFTKFDLKIKKKKNFQSASQTQRNFQQKNEIAKNLGFTERSRKRNTKFPSKDEYNPHTSNKDILSLIRNAQFKEKICLKNSINEKHKKKNTENLKINNKNYELLNVKTAKNKKEFINHKFTKSESKFNNGDFSSRSFIKEKLNKKQQDCLNSYFNNDKCRIVKTDRENLLNVCNFLNLKEGKKKNSQDETQGMKKKSKNSDKNLNSFKKIKSSQQKSIEYFIQKK